MRFKFILAIAMILCAFCILPVNASYVYDINDISSEITWNNNPLDSIIIIQFYTGKTIIGGGERYLVDNNYIFSAKPVDDNYSMLNQEQTIAQGMYESAQNLVFYLNPYKRGLNEYEITNNVNSNVITISYNIDDSYHDPLGNVYIDKIKLEETNNSIIYQVQCFPYYNMTYCEISSTQQSIKTATPLNSIGTLKIFEVGETGYNVYSVAYSGITGQKTLIQEYLTGKNEQPIEEPTTQPTVQPTTQPTAQPTDTPVYPERIQAIIQTFDYQTGNILSGVNMSLYEVIDHGEYGTLGRRLFTAQNAESQIILNLKTNTEYFIKNELGGYFAVKNTNYTYLNNENGYLWNITITNPLKLYYSRLEPTAQYNANFIVQDVNNNGIAGVSVTMDNSITKISNSIGGLTFNNVSAGQHTFTFSKTGYQTAQRTIDIQLQYAAFTQTLFKENQIIQPTVQPTTYPTIQPTVQPTIQPIDKPENLADSVKYGLAKIFGVNKLDTINLVFALMLILFPAVIGAVVTNQALGFIAGGMMGFVFALGLGLIPIWIFFAMVMFTVIYLILTHGTSGEF